MSLKVKLKVSLKVELKVKLKVGLKLLLKLLLKVGYDAPWRLASSLLIYPMKVFKSTLGIDMSITTLIIGALCQN